VLIIPGKINNNVLIIPSQSNRVLLRADEGIEHKLITVKKHEINNNVIIANSQSRAKGVANGASALRRPNLQC